VTNGLGVKRGVAEFLLIVLGVVAALGVDRWVQGIDDDRTEQEYLTLVLADLEANAQIFESMVADWGAARDAAAELSVAVATRSRPSDSGLLIAVARAGTVSTIPARDASFRDMESTGNVRIISDRELRSEIVSYFTFHITFGRPIIEDRLDLRFRTFARERLPAGFNHRAQCPPSTPSFECSFSDPPSADHIWAALVGDPSMRELLISRHADAISGTGFTTQWLRRTDELRSLLQEALAS
jgi:hypothetical protein